MRSASAGKVLERPVELGQLVDSLVANQGLADEDDLVRIVDRYKLGSAAMSYGEVIIGYDRTPTLAKARMSGSLSCIRPAVSINTTSNLFSLAKGQLPLRTSAPDSP